MFTAVFVVSSVVLFLFDRFSHPALPAYIVAGIAIGGFFPAEEMISFTQIGLSFLVFVFGVKLDPERLSLVAKDSIKTTLFQVTAVAALGLALSSLLGFSAFETLIFILATTLSSTLVGLDLLEDEIDLNLAHGRLAESIHLTQDLIAIIFLMLIGISAFTVDTVAQSLFQGISILGAAILFRRYIMDFAASLTESSRELMMMLSITVLAGFISIAQYFNTSIAIGSFAAGLAVSKYPYGSEILDTTGSLKDFFSAIFFVSLGALLSVPTGEIIVISSVMILLTVFFKPYTVTASLISLGQNERTSYLTGFSIDQVSEFSLIITIQVYLAGLISETLFQSVIITATVSMMISSYTAKHGEKLYRFLSKFEPVPSTADEDELSHDIEDHVIIVGYDTQGRRIVEKLIEEDTEFVVVENDPEKISDLEEKQENFVYGDVMNQKTWEKASAHDASLILSTVPLEKISNKILELKTYADIILRAETVEEAQKLLEKGAIYVSIPHILSSELLVDHVKGIMKNTRYREELRRKNMLEIRKYIQDREG